MFISITWILMYITLATSEPIQSIRFKDLEYTKEIGNLKSLEILFTELIQHAKAIRRLTAFRSQETRHTLASVPEQCSQHPLKEMEMMNKKVLYKYYTCSVGTILEDVFEISYSTAQYSIGMYKDTAEIVAEGAACIAAGLNPFSLIACIYKAIKVWPDEIKDIINLTENFEATLDTLMPDLVSAIKKCFNKSSSEYSVFLDDLVDKAKTCESVS